MMRLAENTRSLFTELQSQEEVYRGVGEEKRRWDRRGCYKRRKRARLSGTGHGLLHGSLQAELRSLELVTGRVGVLELLQSLGELLLDLGSGTSLDLASELGRGQVGLDLVEVRLEVGPGLVLGAELLVSGLEPEGVAGKKSRQISRCNSVARDAPDNSLLGILDHLVNLGARQSTNRVLDGDVSLSARGLVLSGNLD